ncbi:SDR family oxidoreductase [Planotetraspora phitsanulokensis]|uniref:SDR family oxidoreductase n=1 Tax=Planotetraspora phitsanulokensis TaxID=575192 RepID=A0A8J3U0W9_9ACTN|nr:glucose 1-dehydrogenase [Planotetraspora phitsanulokensis]GII36463.1 SDR family oxidoreductase [Planotetraspora phitsanulokensis]
MAIPVVLITGALTGIGRAAAFTFAENGAKLVVSGRHEDAGEALVAELRALDTEAMFVRADVRHEADVEGLVDQAVERFGRLDVAVNNAGTEGRVAPIAEQTPESYAGTFDTNVLGTLLSMKHEFRVMAAQGGGSIVNLTSIYGEIGLPSASVYVGSKYAVIGLTKVAALEGAASGIRVNAVAPGYIETAMMQRTTGTDEVRSSVLEVIPLRRFGRPDEIAAAIALVASDACPYLTGQVITVDGGLTAGWPIRTEGM